ncbi:cytochrome P450 [Methylocystis bryophila]|uniref:Cytochrome P450 n=2 Tax=Methylocystis bryophila TaxID=655015 RepID=A0A1W6MTH6_9HYPH|nr:cytochrome P450 [Methylocystis bryophila]BDV36796.1 cytochrome P450 [Methylocystis bryophila]
MFHDPDLMPFTPLEKPSLWAMRENFLVNYPRAAYREDRSVLPGFPPVTPKINLIMSPALIEEMLVTRAEEFSRDRLTVSTLSGPINKESLFFAEGADWKWQRRAVSAAFRHENLLAQVETFAACAREQAALWRRLEAGRPVDVAPAMSRVTFEVILRSVLGAAPSFDRGRFVAELAPALGAIGWRRICAIIGLPPDLIPHPGSFRAAAALRYLSQATRALIEERRASGVARNDLLQLLLSARDPETGRVMTDAELEGNLYTFLVAGHETSAVAMSWSLWLLAKDQATQERLREEVRAVAGEEEIGPATVEKLVFTRQVLQESMRLFPPAAGFARQPRERTTLGPYHFSKGETIAVLIWCLHRHEKLWDDPHGFDPDRFAPEKVKARHRYAYIPFGAGPRICLGMSFAMLEMTTLLATFVREFRFSTAPGHRLVIDARFTTRAKGGMPLLIEPIRPTAEGELAPAA